MRFTSPTRGSLSFDAMFADIIAFMHAQSRDEYKVIVGTDSQTDDDTLFVTAVVVHRIGKGARYYYRKRKQRKIDSLRQKIFYETSLSLSVASELGDRLSHNGHADLNVEVHLDVGPNGETRELIREIVGMVIGSGFSAKIKPDSFGASKVADKHTK